MNWLIVKQTASSVGYIKIYCGLFRPEFGGTLATYTHEDISKAEKFESKTDAIMCSLGINEISEGHFVVARDELLLTNTPNGIRFLWRGAR